jgi:hypothetical protein
MILVLTASAVAAPHASGASSVMCQFVAVVTLTPGAAMMSGSGTFATDGGLEEPSGTLDCGAAGTGTAGFAGTFGTGPTAALGGDGCAVGSGSGSLVYELAGRRTTGTFTWQRLVVLGEFYGSLGDAAIAGTFEFLPADGQDCVNVPVTQATVTGQSMSSGI